MNVVILTGNLGADPEARFTQGGTAVTKFRVATTRRYKGEEQTEWTNIVTFGKTAEIAGEYLKKGSKVGIRGRLQTRDWEDRDGNKRYTTEVICEDLEFLSPKSSPSTDASQGQRKAPDPIEDDFGSDPIPF